VIKKKLQHTPASVHKIYKYP